MEGPVEIDLKKPVQFNGETIAKLSMREPKVRDLLAAEKTTKSDAEREVMVFSNLCAVAPVVIGELSLADYVQLQKAYQSFLS